MGIARRADPACRAARAPRPNPFRTETLLRVDLSEDAAWSFEVFDVSGRRVATLLEAWLPRGRLEVAWDGRRPDGERLPAGVHFVRGLRGGRPVGRPMRLVLTG